MSLRIIAGELKGRRIRVPGKGGVRPTADRVREALFSILGERVPGARVLDLYSGSGALGLEALSRGARQAVFCEMRPETLRENIDGLGVGARSRVVRGAVLVELSRISRGGRFDLILADPPYEANESARLLRQVAALELLEPGGWLVVERATRSGPAGSLPELERCRTARYGDTSLDIYGLAVPGANQGPFDPPG